MGVRYLVLCCRIAFFSITLPMMAFDEVPPEPESQAGQDVKPPSPDTPDPKASRKWSEMRYRNTDHPSFRMGEWLRVDFRFKFMHDFRAFDPEFGGDEGETSNLRRLRVGIKGYVTKDIEFEVEREIRNEVADLLHLRTNTTEALWRDVYVNYRYFRRFQIRGGQFKVPFGMDQVEGYSGNEFVFRSLIGHHLAPGRDVGLMAHGKLFRQRLEYQAGLFRNDGYRIRQADGTRSGTRTFAGRLISSPFEWVKPPRFLSSLKELQLGVAFTESAVPEGLSSPRGRTWFGTHNYFPRVNVRGHRLRLGGELNWTPGPFSLRGEVTRVRDERLGQSLRGLDLPNLISQGWYLSGSWVLTGEAKDRYVIPRRDFGWGKGFGAIEIAARGEQIRFSSAEHTAPPSRSTRAANFAAASERAAAFGVNWYLNRWVRVQFNGVRESIEDPERTPIRNIQTYWSKIVRIQFYL